jgi:UDP-hydrolysing UDP-N-acetyl-D-glucosamine 2-epimerase
VERFLVKIAVFTSGRQDWGILLPVVRALRQTPQLTMVIIASGMHVRDDQRPEHLDDIPIAVLLPLLPSGDSDVAVAQCAGETTAAVAQSLVQQQADALLILGDRSETLAAAVAATCLRLPIIHLHGGEETTGAIDNNCRHAITKLAHLHGVAHEQFRQRLIDMGERPERIITCGAPAIDLMMASPLLDAKALAAFLSVPQLGHPLIVLTHHPTTLASAQPLEEITSVLNGVQQALVPYPNAMVLMTRANADAGGGVINAALTDMHRRDPRFIAVADLGVQRYWSLLALAQVMVGNSSSGILEAPSFHLPVINIGERQHGRLRVHPVQDVPLDATAIATALAPLLSQDRQSCPPTVSAYGDGQAAPRLVAALCAFANESVCQRLDKSKAPT